MMDIFLGGVWLWHFRIMEDYEGRDGKGYVTSHLLHASFFLYTISTCVVTLPIKYWICTMSDGSEVVETFVKWKISRNST